MRVVIDTRVVHDGAALAVVVASGQYLRGNDVVPRGHPGDGRAEVQVYSLTRGERAAMRERLPLGVHLPHPRIRTASGRRVEVQAMGSPRPVEVDGVAVGPRVRSRGGRASRRPLRCWFDALEAAATGKAGGAAAKRGTSRSTESGWPTDTIADPWRRRPKQ